MDGLALPLPLSAATACRARAGRGSATVTADGHSSDAEADAVLMHRVGLGDAAACALLVDRHLDRMVGFAYRLLGDRAAAEDVAQETFLRLWQNAARWRPDAKLTTWLHRVAYNLCIDRLRRSREIVTDEPPEQVDPAPDAVERLHRAAIARQVADAVATLPLRQRTAVTLAHFHEQGNIAVAEIMGLSVEAVESLLARGRRALRERLAGLSAELRDDGGSWT